MVDSGCVIGRNLLLKYPRYLSAHAVTHPGQAILVGTSKPAKTFPKEKKRASVTQSVIVSGGSVIVVLKDRVVDNTLPRVGSNKAV